MRRLRPLGQASSSQPSSRHPSGPMLSASYSSKCPWTVASPTVSARLLVSTPFSYIIQVNCAKNSLKLQVTRQVLNLGVLVALWPVFPVFAEVVLTAPVRVLMVTCAVVVACLHPLKRGGNGTARLMWTRSDMLSARPLLPLVSHPWSCLKVT